MAKTKISEYDSTAANNTDIDSINIAEGMAPSNVNNAIRELMAHLKDGLGAGTPVFLDQTNNRLGVGNAAPATALDVTGTVTADGLTVDTGGDIEIAGGQNLKTIGTLQIQADYDGSGTGVIRLRTNALTRQQIDNNGDISFYEDTGTTAKLFWDASAESLGIGTTSPTAKLDVRGGIRIADTISDVADGGRPIFYASDGSGAHTTHALVIQARDGAGSEIDFVTGTTPTTRMRIDSSGDLLVGKTSDDNTDTGLVVNGNGFTKIVRSSATANVNSVLQLNRLSSEGEILVLQKDGTEIGIIGCNSGNHLTVGKADTGIAFQANEIISPYNPTANVVRDNAIDLGASSARFDDIYATNGTIQTSDENEKQQIASLTDAEITAAKAISKLFKTFKWNDSVAEKGDAARTHTGVIAQQVETAMSDAGLDAGDYAFFISTTWWEADGEVYNTSEEAPEGATERNRKGIRYPELLSFIGAATEQRLTSIEARLDALEG